MNDSTASNSRSAETFLSHVHVRVENGDGRMKLVQLPLQDEPVPMGVRDEVAAHYRLADGDYIPATTTLDYLVGAIAGCLAGTFGGRLAALGQSASDGALVTEATGELVVADGVIRVRSVDLRYELKIADGIDAAKVRRAHETHARFCPVAQSVKGSIEITTHLEIVTPKA